MYICIYIYVYVYEFTFRTCIYINICTHAFFIALHSSSSSSGSLPEAGAGPSAEGSSGGSAMDIGAFRQVYIYKQSVLQCNKCVAVQLCKEKGTSCLSADTQMCCSVLPCANVLRRQRAGAVQVRCMLPPFARYIYTHRCVLCTDTHRHIVHDVTCLYT